MRPRKARFIIRKLPIAAAESFLMPQNSGRLMIRPRRNFKTGIAMTFKHDQFGFIVMKHLGLAKRRQRQAFDSLVGALLPDHQKIGDRFDFNRGANRAAIGEDNYRKDSLILDEALVSAGERRLGESGQFELLFEFTRMRNRE